MRTQKFVVTIKRGETHEFKKARMRAETIHARRVGFLYGVIITSALLLLLLILDARAENTTNEADAQSVLAEHCVPECVSRDERSEAPELIAAACEADTLETCVPVRDYAAEAEVLAKVVYGEARGCSTTEQAAVIWCVLNRVDDDSGYWPDDVIEAAAQDMQFHGYDRENPVLPEIYKLAFDVLDRWQREKEGEKDVGRVLPADYYYFHGDGIHNYFRKEWSGNAVWDWSLKSPYEE